MKNYEKIQGFDGAFLTLENQKIQRVTLHVYQVNNLCYFL